MLSYLRLEVLLIFLCRDVLQGNQRHFVCLSMSHILCISSDALVKLLNGSHGMCHVCVYMHVFLMPASTLMEQAVLYVCFFSPLMLLVIFFW